MRSEVRILSGAMFHLNHQISMIIETKPQGPIGTNALLIGCENTGKCAFFDAPFGSLDWYKKQVKHHKLSPLYLLLTHSHWDHIGDAAAIKAAFDLQVMIHKEDSENLLEPGSDQLELYQPIKGVLADQFLVEGQIIRVGEITIEVIHTPGHTPGGVCFYIEKEGVLISGDTLFRGTIGTLALPTANSDRMWKSLKKLAKLPPDTVVYPGHGPTTQIKNEPFLDHAEDYFG